MRQTPCDINRKSPNTSQTLFNFPKTYKRRLENKGGINKEAKTTWIAHKEKCTSLTKRFLLSLSVKVFTVPIDQISISGNSNFRPHKVQSCD